MSVADQIKNKLTEAFAPQTVDVIDESHKHEGHAGARPEGETHFRVFIVSDQFEGQNRVMRQRAVNKVLEDELQGQVHALALRTLTPDEAAQDAERP